MPAVRTLGLVGAESDRPAAARLGFAAVVEAGDFYGPSLALGSADVTLWELVDAYRTLANGGVWSPLRMAAGDAAGREPPRLLGARGLPRLDILADRESRSVTFGLENPLATRFWTAVKTGTSKDMRDNWCVGFSRRYTVGVWVGNFSGEPMHDVSGVTGAAPVWLEVMERLHGRRRARRRRAPPAGSRAGEVAFAGAVEPARARVVQRRHRAAATAPDRDAGGPAHPRPGRPGTIIALDPDIPAGRQRVPFEARDAGPVSAGCSTAPSSATRPTSCSGRPRPGVIG